VPAKVALVGTRFFQQAIVPDPGAGNAAGLRVPDAGAATVGS
jgi:hypothetical protein